MSPHLAIHWHYPHHHPFTSFLKSILISPVPLSAQEFQFLGCPQICYATCLQGTHDQLPLYHMTAHKPESIKRFECVQWHCLEVLVWRDKAAGSWMPAGASPVLCLSSISIPLLHSMVLSQALFPCTLHAHVHLVKADPS